MRRALRIGAVLPEIESIGRSPAPSFVLCVRGRHPFSGTAPKDGVGPRNVIRNAAGRSRPGKVQTRAVPSFVRCSRRETFVLPRRAPCWRKEMALYSGTKALRSASRGVRGGSCHQAPRRWTETGREAFCGIAWNEGAPSVAIFSTPTLGVVRRPRVGAEEIAVAVDSGVWYHVRLESYVLKCCF